ncbi:5-formyltetrahydrofolate cyclo-ligase [Sporolactobacillus inulinus]|jgi:5-formyltetrahydrofolate cyclo-ligase|uniref:5-formyltetrahydrofolate cyclo-ligase n=2 Tax=Sporolactobacillus inulinus TaxID=2078 RepID=A0A4Y1Z8P6_9BACL|nr:5-formyltetrahydrofolate cyclo-ligase [Sporolactobacillus inulinus]
MEEIMKSQKKSLRNQILHAMESLDDAVFTEKCKQIRERLFDTAIWHDAQVIGITLSVGREVETMAIITRAWTENKRIVVPKCNPKAHSMTFYGLDTFSQLESSFYGLMEPDPKKTQKQATDAIDLLIVPGVVFNHEGYRIGYGGGYYDRFLEGFKGITASLLLEQQFNERLPVEPHDQQVGWLITERGCFKVK